MMGWFPARDDKGKVIPGMLEFPAPAAKAKGLKLQQWGVGASNSGGVGRRARRLKRGYGPVTRQERRRK